MKKLAFSSQALVFNILHKLKNRSANQPFWVSGALSLQLLPSICTGWQWMPILAFYDKSELYDSANEPTEWIIGQQYP